MSTRPSFEVSHALLRTLHRIHRQLTDLRDRIARGPRQIKAGEAIVAKAQAEMEAAKQKVTAAKLVSDEKQLQLQSRELRIEELKVRLNSAATNKEFTLLRDQIAADEQANSVLSDEILEGLEHLDTLQQSLSTCQTEWAEQQETQAKRVVDVEEKLVQLKEELARVEAELAEAEQGIPVAARAEYKRITAAKGEDALAPIDGQSCGGCNQMLTTQVISTLQLSQLVRCPNCNAILYIPEDLRP